MKTFVPAYPTPEHQKAAEAVTRYFKPMSQVDAVLLVGSCARGKASPDSCLDMVVLVPVEVLATQRQALEEEWKAYQATQPVFEAVQRMGRFSSVELEFIDGNFRPGHHDWTSGPDGFELDIGNYLVYGKPLWVNGPRLAKLQSQWLPYYAEDLRQTRLAQVRYFCLNNLDHIPLYNKRGLYFQCLSRLWNAHREFLQALFVAKRVYPIAYDKWIKEQVVDILELPELYAELVGLFEISHFESAELTEKAQVLRELLEQYAPPG